METKISSNTANGKSCLRKCNGKGKEYRSAVILVKVHLECNILCQA